MDGVELVCSVWSKERGYLSRVHFCGRAGVEGGEVLAAAMRSLSMFMLLKASKRDVSPHTEGVRDI